MFGVCFLMHKWGTEHKKWDSGVRKIQVKKYYCFMTDTVEQMTPVYRGDPSYSEFSLSSSELPFKTISLLENVPGHFNVIAGAFN